MVLVYRMFFPSVVILASVFVHLNLKKPQVFKNLKTSVAKDEFFLALVTSLSQQ